MQTKKQIMTEQEAIDRVKKAIVERAEFLLKCKENPKLASVEYELCRQDIMHRFDNWMYTDKNSLFGDEFPSSIPFLPFEYQIEAINEIWETISENAKSLSNRKK
jgi:hypothetical protein